MKEEIPKNMKLDRDKLENKIMLKWAGSPGIGLERTIQHVLPPFRGWKIEVATEITLFWKDLFLVRDIAISLTREDERDKMRKAIDEKIEKVKRGCGMIRELTDEKHFNKVYCKGGKLCDDCKFKIEVYEELTKNLWKK